MRALLDTEVADTLKRTATAVSMSLDGSTRELHEAIRLVPGCFEETLTALELLEERGVPVGLIFSHHRANRADLHRFLERVPLAPRSRLKVNPIISSGRARAMERRGELLSVAELQEFIRTLEAQSDTLNCHGCSPPSPAAQTPSEASPQTDEEPGSGT